VGAGILPDLILAAVIFAVVITPLGQFGQFGRPWLHPVRAGTDRPVIGLPVWPVSRGPVSLGPVHGGPSHWGPSHWGRLPPLSRACRRWRGTPRASR
jgi:hypothetical protein